MGAGDVDPAVVGEWRATAFSGLDVVLKIDADGTCSLAGMVGKCVARDGELLLQSDAGGVKYRYALQGGKTLTLSGGDLDRPFQFVRVGAEPPKARAPSAAAAAFADAQAPGAPAAGTEFFNELWGVRFRPPPAWRYVERGGGLLVISDVEAGLMIGQFRPKVGQDQLEQEMRQPIQQQQAQLSPTERVSESRVGEYVVLSSEYAGTSNDGAKLRMRAIAVLSPWGAAFVILALTTEGKFPVLRTRAEELVRSVRFEAPKRPASGFLAGRYWAYTGNIAGGTTLRESTLTLSPDGTFLQTGETYAARGSDGKGYDTLTAEHRGTGLWEVLGDEAQGILLLSFADGTNAQVPYIVSRDPSDLSAFGPAVIFGGTKYQRTGSGKG
jgi:hypothetical protein